MRRSSRYSPHRSVSPAAVYEHHGDNSTSQPTGLELEAENQRLRAELQRVAHVRSSSEGRDTLCSVVRRQRSSRRATLHGRMQEQLREVEEENELLSARLRAREKDVEDLRAEHAELRSRLEANEKRQFEAQAGDAGHPKDIQLFRQHVQDTVQRMQEERDQDLTKAEKIRNSFVRTIQECQARNAMATSEVVQLEKALAESQANRVQHTARIDDLERQCDELKTMLQGERNASEVLQAKVLGVEQELEAERQMRGGRGGETLGMLDGFQGRCREDSGSSTVDDGGRREPEVSGRYEEQLAELQRECERLRAQLALANCPPPQRRPSIAADHQALQKPLAGKGEEELRKLPADEEGLQLECKQLRDKLGAAEAQLAEAKREKELLQRQLESAQEHARLSGQSADSQPEVVREATAKETADTAARPGSGPGTDSLASECEHLRKQLAAAEEELARTRSTDLAARASMAMSPVQLLDVDCPAAHDGRRSSGRKSEVDQELARRARRSVLRVAQSFSMASPLQPRPGVAEAPDGDVRGVNAGLLARLPVGLPAGFPMDFDGDPREWGLKVAAAAVWQEYERLRREIGDDADSGEGFEEDDGPLELEGSGAEPHLDPAYMATLGADATRLLPSNFPGPSSIQEADAVCHKCAKLQEELEAYEEIQQGLRTEQQQLKKELANAVELQQEQLRTVEHLQRRLRATCGAEADVPIVAVEVVPMPQEEPAPALGGPQSAGTKVVPTPEEEPAPAPDGPQSAGAEASQGLQLAGASHETDLQLAGAKEKVPPSRAKGETAIVAEERDELSRRNQELLSEYHRLEKQLEAALLNGGTEACLVEEMSRLRQECDTLRQKVHDAKMALLDAERKADVIPGLESRVLKLEREVREAELDAAEWQKVANESGFGGIFSSFLCATSRPERR
uniref:Uncharacterized protein n=1 Tax=Alexandrium monilatum TaxID=311494 RepID=A0A7S4VVB4_9DINO